MMHFNNQDPNVNNSYIVTSVSATQCFLRVTQAQDIPGIFRIIRIAEESVNMYRSPTFSTAWEEEVAKKVRKAVESGISFPSVWRLRALSALGRMTSGEWRDIYFTALVEGTGAWSVMRSPFTPLQETVLREAGFKGSMRWECRDQGGHYGLLLKALVTSGWADSKEEAYRYEIVQVLTATLATAAFRVAAEALAEIKVAESMAQSAVLDMFLQDCKERGSECLGCPIECQCASTDRSCCPELPDGTSGDCNRCPHSKCKGPGQLPDPEHYNLIYEYYAGVRKDQKEKAKEKYRPWDEGKTDKGWKEE